MDVEVVTTKEGLDSLQKDWLRLEQADSTATFFSEWRCVTAWWGSYSEDGNFQLLVHVARQNGRVVGLLPLALHQQRVHAERYAVLRFASHGDTMGALVDPDENGDTVCRSLFDAALQREDWDLFDLVYLPEPSPMLAYLRRSEHSSSTTHLIELPVLELQGQDLNELRVPGKTRKYRNKLFREHDVRFQIYYDNEGGILERLGRLHQREKLHLQEGGRSERHSWFDDGLRYGHYERLFNRPGSAVTFAYERGNELVAARSTFIHGSRLLSWTSAYHPDLEDYRLGKCLQLSILEHLRDPVKGRSVVSLFDFGTGGYGWKYEWTDECRHAYRLRIVRRPRPKRPAKATAVAQRLDADRQQGAASSQKKSNNRVAKNGDDTPKTRPTRAPAAARSPERRRRQPISALPRRTYSKARRTQRWVRGSLTGQQVWYLSEPADLVTQFANLISKIDRQRLVIVLLGHGDIATKTAQVGADLEVPLSETETLRASEREFLAAAASLGVDEQRILLPEDERNLVAKGAVALISRLALKHPNALHIVPTGKGAPPRNLGRVLSTAARKRSLAVKRLELAAPAHEWSAEMRQAAEEFLVWDPDAGRYAVHRSRVSRHQRQTGTPSPNVP